MSQKTFFINLNNQKVFDNKLLGEMYCKCIIRSKENDVLTVDNNKTLFNTISKKEVVAGSSLLTRTFFFAHKLDQKLKFKSFLSINNYRTKNLLQNIILKINLITTIKKQANNLVLLGPKKGGFYGIILSTTGFIPKAQGRVLLKTILNCTRLKNNCLLKIVSLLLRNFYIKNFYVFKINCNHVKMKFYPMYKNYNFSKPLTKKTRKNNTMFNFVFYKKKYEFK
jgi:hypothetical protein